VWHTAVEGLSHCLMFSLASPACTPHFTSRFPPLHPSLNLIPPFTPHIPSSTPPTPLSSSPAPPSSHPSPPENDIRLRVLTVLDSKFDAHLAQPENITTLFIALHDENFYVREAALATIGRLSDLNPAFVMPSLRKVLIQILTELEYSGIGRNKEQSAKLLCHLISQAPNLVKPYKEAILKVDVTVL